MTPTIRIGDVIRDNDPRMPGRFLEVVNVYSKFVSAGNPRATVPSYEFVPIKRIHTDGKPRKSGFDLLPRETRE